MMTLVWLQKNRNCQLVKGNIIPTRTTLQAISRAKRRSKERIWIGKQGRNWHMQSVFVAGKFDEGWRAWRPAKPWYREGTGPYVQYALAHVNPSLRKASYSICRRLWLTSQFGVSNFSRLCSCREACWKHDPSWLLNMPAQALTVLCSLVISWLKARAHWPPCS